MLEEISHEGFTAKLGSDACPEQWDVFDDEGKLVGSTRLRGGKFRVYCPAYSETVVFQALAGDAGSLPDEQREIYIKAAISAIDDKVNGWDHADYEPPDPQALSDRTMHKGEWFYPNDHPVTMSAGELRALAFKLDRLQRDLGTYKGALKEIRASETP